VTCTNDLLLVEHLGDISGHDDQRSSGIDSSSSVLQLELLLSETNLLQLDLPVSLSPDGNVLDLASVGILVNTTKDGLSSILFAGSESEREYGLIEQLLVKHVVEGGYNVVDRDGVVG
jgi:hypothetical protein